MTQPQSSNRQRACERCGTMFRPRLRGARPSQKFCSVACRLPDLRERFMSRVRVPDHDGECWIWTGTLRHGYGQLSVGGRTQAAHRLAWELFRGPIPGRLKVLHNCPGGDNPACVNPAHLFLGTQADNVRDMLVKGRNDPVVGERHPKAKLTPEAVREIRALYAAGKANQYELAARFGVGQSTIGRVVRGKGWYHVS